MNKCIFCKIAAGKLPAYQIYADSRYMAFLDIHALTKGHALVIPREHIQWTYNVPYFGEYFEVARKIALAAQQALAADWICFLTVGLDIPHAHIHVIPRYKDDLHGAVVQLGRTEKYTSAAMKEIAEKIRRQLQHDQTQD